MNRLYKRILAAFLMVAILMTVAGCSGGETEPTEKETDPKQTEAT